MSIFTLANKHLEQAYDLAVEELEQQNLALDKENLTRPFLKHVSAIADALGLELPDLGVLNDFLDEQLKLVEWHKKELNELKCYKRF